MGMKLAAFWLALMACAGTAAADEDAEAAIGDTRLNAGDDVQFDSQVKGNAFAACGRVAHRACRSQSIFSAATSGVGTIDAISTWPVAICARRLYGEMRAAGGKHPRRARRVIEGSAASRWSVSGWRVGETACLRQIDRHQGAIPGPPSAPRAYRIGPDARIAGKVENRGGRPRGRSQAVTVAASRRCERQAVARRWARRDVMGGHLLFGSC